MLLPKRFLGQIIGKYQGYSSFLKIQRGFPSSSDGGICLQCGRPGFDPWVRKIPLEKEMVTHSSILAWKILWTEESDVHGVTKSWI